MLRNVLTVDHLPNEVLLELFRSADALRCGAAAVKHRTADWKPLVAENLVMATLFFEPSTRTRLSFETAWQKLGGRVVSACESSSLSMSKGESLADTIEAVSYMADLIVVRATQPLYEWFNGGDGYYSRVPIINGGDGGNNHPTQALLDAYTLWRHDGRPSKPIPSNKTFGVVGDLDKSRTIRSFVEMFCRDQMNHFVLFDSTGRNVPLRVRNRCADIRHVHSVAEFEELMPTMDCIYLNRVQKERHVSGEALASTFVLTEKHLNSLKDRCIVLNPGPRREELPVHLSHWNAVRMWPQVENGMYVRMALLRKLLDKTPLDRL